MISGLFLRLFACLSFFSFFVYSYLDKQNSCTQLQLRLPKVTKEIEVLREANGSLHYQIECFENPEHLLQIAAQPAYAHLKFPFTAEVLTVKEGLALQWSSPEEQAQKTKPKAAVVLGAK